jgi:tetratricopeptide (TPR) repeat protein
MIKNPLVVSTLVVLGLGAVGVFALVSTGGIDKLRARDNLNKGVQAFKTAKYNQAVEHFEKAIQHEPTYVNARLYLGMAYFSQYIPGADSPENNQNAKAASDQFLKVLELEPKNTTAINTLASLHFQQAQGQALDVKIKKLDEAKEWYEKLAEVDPQNKEAYYTLGVISWAKFYPQRMAARAKLGMKPEDPGPIKDKKLKEELKAQWMPTIDSGLKHLEKALEIDKEYDDAMAYYSLLLREKGDLADTAEEYNKANDMANDWVQRSLDTKKIKNERQSSPAQPAE